MNPKYVPSLELCKQLEKMGWIKETEFWWSLCSDIESTNYGCGEFRITAGGLHKETRVERYPAPLSDEILEELLSQIEIDTHFYNLQIVKVYPQRWGVYYEEPIKIFADTLPNALAKCLLYLMNNGIISLEGD